MYAFGLTDTGRRRNQNQDAFFISTQRTGPLPNLFIMADGMGGHKAGDVASQQAVARFCSYVTAAQLSGNYIDLLLGTAQRVNQELYDMARENPEEMHGMGTTFIACVIEDGRADVVHVGDSRAYIIKPGEIKQITHDHTYAEELFRAGQITAEEARIHPKRHHLTRVLGFDPHVKLDGFFHSIEKGASLLLCSDGLHDMLDDPAIMAIVNQEGYVEHRTQILVDEANARGGVDNISAVLIDLRGGSDS
ncbi:MAG: Stp1/IreP family PP2C-type Ser/Thr phosphatase [Defluviitaleaceae bacterium]|nr:Stp1/IreP family PP2C-type Ser/Thr phosphatase [Defluviitaleaceae bacterium]